MQFKRIPKSVDPLLLTELMALSRIMDAANESLLELPDSSPAAEVCALIQSECGRLVDWRVAHPDAA